MLKKICPHCDRPSYSSVSVTQVWDCPYCGQKFVAVEGEEQGRKLEREGEQPLTNKR